MTMVLELTAEPIAWFRPRLYKHTKHHTLASIRWQPSAPEIVVAFAKISFMQKYILNRLQPQHDK